MGQNTDAYHSQVVVEKAKQILVDWDFEKNSQIPEILRQIAIVKGVDIDKLPPEVQKEVAHVVFHLWVEFENEVISQIASDKVQLHWRMFLRSHFNARFLASFPELEPLIQYLTLKFINE